MKKISLYVFLLLVCATVAFYGVSHPAPVSQNNTATYAAWFHEMTVFPITETARASESPTITLTPTITITSTPTSSSTSIATIDYPRLVSKFLTPFTPLPTYTRNPNQPPQPTRGPTWTPTIDPLKLVISKKLPANWTPTPLPPILKPVETPSEWTYQFAPNWIATRLQAVTDLMNFTHADQKSFMEYIDAWGPSVYSSHWSRTWFLKNDLDHDGQLEWLVSIPIYSEETQISCCKQMMILFEKKGDVYQPVYYNQDEGSAFHGHWQILQVSDLNQNGYLDVVTSTTRCGVACSTRINISEWNGQKWRDYNGFYAGGNRNGLSEILFMDVDGNRTTEIIVKYVTAYYMDADYPLRNAVDIYSWKNGQYTKFDTWLQPNKTPYAVLRDVYSALKVKDTNEALRLAQPALDNLAQTCSIMDTYTAIEVMLAHAMRNEPKEMEATLSYILASCNSPKNPPKTPAPNQLKNGYIPAANILWLAYQKTHSPLLACQAMERFVIDQIRGEKAEFSFQAGMLAYNFGVCPIK